MKVSGQGYQEFFAELKRRKVFRVMAVYGATAFVVLQVADLLAEGMGLSDQVLRITTFLVLIGFPIAIVLAWAFETTPDGVRRTQDATDQEIDAIIAAPASERIPAGLMALVGVVALVLSAYWVGTRSAGEAATVETSTDARLAFADPGDDSRPSIVVLPFADMSPERDQEYFSDGITDEILNTLAKIRDLSVQGRTSAFAYKGRNADLRTIGDELGVGYLLEGSVRKSGDRLRITVQLIDSGTGSHLWSEQFDRKLDDVFAIQTEIAEEIARELRLPLGLQEDERLVLPTEDLQAYDLYLAGRARLRVREIFEAIDLFEAAIARDSTWAPPWAGLAESRALVPYYAPDADSDTAVWAENLESAQQAARRALELDPYNASAFVALANVHRDRARWSEAEHAYRSALELDPDDAEAHQEYAEYLYYVGRMDEAYASAKRAVALDPAPIRFSTAAFAATLVERYEEAYDLVAEGLRKDPDLVYLQDMQTLLPLAAGDLASSRSALLQYVERFDEGQAFAKRLTQVWPAGTAPPPEAIELMVTVSRGAQPAAALTWLATGRRDRALETLEQYAEPEGLPLFGNLFLSGFDSIRDDPRFQVILASRGLEGRVPQRLAPEEGP